MTAGPTTPAAAVDSALLNAMFSELTAGLAFVDLDMRYVRVNAALARMNGVAMEDHLGRTVHDVLGRHAPRAAALFARAIADRMAVDGQFTARTGAHADEDRVYRVTCLPVADGGGNPIGVVGVVRDVTERERHEREREQFLREALDARGQAEAAQARAEAALAEAHRAKATAERAQTEAEQQRRAAEHARRRATFLSTVTRRLAASLDFEATLREVVASAVPQIADWCMVSVVEADGGLRLLGAAHHDPARVPLAERFASRYVPGPGSSMTAMLRTGRGQLLTDLDDERLADIVLDSECRRWLHELGTRHVGTWPILHPRGGVIGALSLVLGDSGRRFSSEDVDLAEALSSRAGLHMSNARLFTESAQIARALQASLLPRALPDIPGVRLASVFLPAGEATLVGGDFLDVFPAAEDSWTATIGDVAGKGPEAAAVTGLARTALRTAALTAPSPRANLELLNRMLHADPAVSRFCTVVSARLQPRDGRVRVTLANAGHPPPLLLRAGGAVDFVHGGRGPLVGVFADARFEETVVVLAPGDRLILHTDGITETRRRDGQGERRLIDAVGAAAGQPPQVIAQAIRDVALQIHDGAPADDITALVIAA